MRKENSDPWTPVQLDKLKEMIDMRAFTKMLILFSIFGSVASSVAADIDVVIEESWNGISPNKKDNDRWREAPSEGVVASQKTLEKLWKDWGVKKEMPKVDFRKNLVLVSAGPGPNLIRIKELKRGTDGDLKFTWTITERGGDGFSYVFTKIPRLGIKTVNGKAIPKE